MTREDLMTIAIVAMALYIIASTVIRTIKLLREIRAAQRATLHVFSKTNDYGETEFFVKLECQDDFFNSLVSGNHITPIQVKFEPQNKHLL